MKKKSNTKMNKIIYNEKLKAPGCKKRRDWQEMLNNCLHPEVADTLEEAKLQNKMFYRHECTVHGPVCYRTKDNTCPHCVTAQSRRRRAINPKFNRPREKFFALKDRAQDRHFEFELDLDWLREQMLKESHCPVTGIKFTETPTDSGNFDNCSSVDRFDSNKGYTKDNCFLISTKINRIKSNGNYYDFIKILSWMAHIKGIDITKLTHDITETYNNHTITLQLYNQKN